MTWLDLPAALRRRVEVVLQAQVHGFEPAAGGFTVGGVVGVVRGSNDNRLFVKAVGDDNPAADDLLIGTNVAQVLPATVPAPRVRLLINSDRWWLAAFDAVDGHPAREPWDDKELNAVLRALTTSARALTPAPNVQVPHRG